MSKFYSIINKKSNDELVNIYRKTLMIVGTLMAVFLFLVIAVNTYK